MTLQPQSTPTQGTDFCRTCARRMAPDTADFMSATCPHGGGCVLNSEHEPEESIETVRPLWEGQ